MQLQTANRNMYIYTQIQIHTSVPLLLLATFQLRPSAARMLHVQLRVKLLLPLQDLNLCVYARSILNAVNSYVGSHAVPMTQVQPAARCRYRYRRVRVQKAKQTQTQIQIQIVRHVASVACPFVPGVRNYLFIMHAHTNTDSVRYMCVYIQFIGTHMATFFSYLHIKSRHLLFSFILYN